MRATPSETSPGAGGRVRVVNLSLPLRLAVPSLLISSIPRGAIGFSFESGLPGATVGAVLLVGSFLLGAALYDAAGPLSFAISLWLIGSTGAVMMYNSSRGLAFVKPLCTGCRLLPIIKEHEAMHVNGIESDKLIWNAMRTQYSFEGLSLGSDPMICSFCPIVKHLKEH